TTVSPARMARSEGSSEPGEGSDLITIQIQHIDRARSPGGAGSSRTCRLRDIGGRNPGTPAAAAILTFVNDQPARVTRYFEDYVPGLAVDCGSFSVSEQDIVAFAAEYDPQPFHVDPVAAKASPYGGLIASGWQTTAKMMRQLVEYFVSPESSLGAAGVDEVRW